VFWKIAFFGLKRGQGLETPGRPHKKFPGKAPTGGIIA